MTLQKKEFTQNPKKKNFLIKKKNFLIKKKEFSNKKKEKKKKIISFFPKNKFAKVFGHGKSPQIQVKTIDYQVRFTMDLNKQAFQQPL